MKLCVFTTPGCEDNSKKVVTLALSFCLLAFVAVRTAIGAPKDAEGNKRSAFVGTWKGICEDKKPFVIVTLREDKGQMTGTVSIGNMHGNVDGGCEEVVDIPTPEHAKEIHDAKVEGSTLSFNWGDKTGKDVSKFQFKLVGSKEAELRFFGTPAENNPWKLVKE